VLSISSIPPHSPSFDYPRKTLPFSLSQGEEDLPCGEALPFDPGATEGIPGLTVTSSSIPFEYFIDSLFLYPWILLLMVQSVKHED
jgi:hypothetical protein